MQHASDSKHCRRCGARVRVRRGLPRAPRAATAARTAAAQRPTPTVAAERIRCDGTRAPRVHAAHPGGRASGRAPAARALQRLQRARRRGAVPRRWGSRSTRRRRGCARCAAAFGRAERIAIGGRRAVDPARQEPRGRQRGAAHARRSSAGELDLLAILNDRIADGRDVSWMWDADFELLAGRVRRVTCAGTRAAELALRLKYAGVDPAQRMHVVPELARGARRRARRRATRPRCTRSRPTPRCSSCATSCAERGHAGRVLGADDGRVSVIWHDVECGAYAEDLALWRALAAEHGGPGARRRRRHRPRGARPGARAGTT